MASIPENQRLLDEYRSLEDIILLPGNGISIAECASNIYSKATGLFLRGGRVVQAVSDDRGSHVLEPVSSEALRSIVERFGKVFAVRSSKSGPVITPSVCPNETAKALLAAEERRRLKTIAKLLRYPALVNDGEQIRLLEHGFDPRTGTMVTSRSKTTIPPVVKAVTSIERLLDDFNFATPSDRSRMLACILTPGLVLGGFLRGRAPIIVHEADQSQTGKTYAQRCIAALYGEELRIVSPRTEGVGSLEESISTRLIQGGALIQIDNVRGRIDSQKLEAFATAESTFMARAAYSSEIEVDPRSFVLFLTSNGMESTRDLANRSVIVRLRKHPDEFQFQQDLLLHIRENGIYYLGCVYSVIKDWFERGRPMTNEGRHDFREWARITDWIVQNTFGCPPIMNGHREQQQRISEPALSFVRILCLSLEKNSQLGEQLSAGRLAEHCIDEQIAIPGLAPDKQCDEEYARRVLGKIFKKFLGQNGEREAEGFIVNRQTVTDFSEADNEFEKKIYIFSRKQVSLESPQTDP